MFFYSTKQSLGSLAVFEARHVQVLPSHIASMRRLANRFISGCLSEARPSL